MQFINSKKIARTSNGLNADKHWCFMHFVAISHAFHTDVLQFKYTTILCVDSAEISFKGLKPLDVFVNSFSASEVNMSVKQKIMGSLTFHIGRLFGKLSLIFYKLHLMRLGKKLNNIENWWYCLLF